MSGASIPDFLLGAVTTGYAVAGLMFLQFWRRTGDRLFAAFAAAFWLMGLGQVLIEIAGNDWWEYMPRLLGFALIVVAIIDKNRSNG